MTRTNLTVAIAAAILLTACGGGSGGSNVKTDPPPPPTPEARRYTGVEDNLRIPVNADVATGKGFDGAGVKVGLLDEGRTTDAFAPLAGRVAYYRDFVAEQGAPATATSRPSDHGMSMASIIAGQAAGSFKGGVAPGASLYWARVCNGTCDYPLAAAAARDLAAQGVRIANLSLGIRVSGQDTVTAGNYWAWALDPLIKADALIVTSTGNDGADGPGFPAATPSIAPQTQANFLAVTALNVAADGTANSIAAFANRCGVAAGWCLAAPETVTVYQGGTVSGTSISAAIVSGVAAQVAQAFPWMSASNLQQTLLTTAQDLGAPGVDPVFGWGKVDAGRAVVGPARFTGDFVADVVGSSTFSNDIDGPGALAKRGDGTLTLSGKTTFGGIDIDGGTLVLRGDFSNAVAVRRGMFQSAGGRISGDYTAGPAATTAIAIGQPLRVGGKATLDGSLLLQAPASTYTPAAREEILSAGAVDGHFTTLQLANDLFYQAALEYGATSVHVALTKISAQSAAAAAALPQSAQDGARQVDAVLLSPAPSALLQDGAALSLSRIMAAPQSIAASSLASLAGGVHGAQRGLALRAVLDQSRIATGRLGQLKDGSTDEPWFAITGSESGISRAGYSHADALSKQVTLGSEVAAGGAVVGGFVAASSLSGHTGGDGRFQADQRSAGAYAIRDRPSGHLLASAAITSGEIRSQRALLIGPSSEQVASQHHDFSWSARLEAGLTLPAGVTAYGGLSALEHRQGRFAETSASGLGLAAAATTARASMVDAGFRANRSWGNWLVNLDVGYMTVVRHDGMDFAGWFTGAPGAVFSIAGAPLARESARMIAGMQYQLGGQASLFAQGSYGALGSGEDDVTAACGVRLAF